MVLVPQGKITLVPVPTYEPADNARVSPASAAVMASFNVPFPGGTLVVLVKTLLGNHAMKAKVSEMRAM